MKKITTLLFCLFLAISSAFTTNFVPDPNSIYHIVESTVNNVIGVGNGTQPVLMDKQYTASQEFHFVSVAGKTDTYYIINGDNNYLNRKGTDDNYTTIYEAAINGTNSEWVIEGADAATGIRLKNNNNNQYLASNYTDTWQNLYTDKAVDDPYGLYKLEAYFVPDPNKILNIVESTSNNVIGVGKAGSQPALTDKQDLASQAFKFVPTGAPGTYYLLSSTNLYLNVSSTESWKTVAEAAINGTKSEWVIQGADATTGIRLKNNSTGYMGADATSYGSSLWTNKGFNDHVLYKLQEATIYTGTPSTVYNEPFSPAGVSQGADWTGAPSILAGGNKWSGGIDLQTEGDGNLNLVSWYWNFKLNLTSADSALIIPDINVAGYDNLQFSYVGGRFNSWGIAPTLYVKVGAGAWVLQSTQAVGNWSNWETGVSSIKDASNIQLSGVSTISLKISVNNSDAANPFYIDNIKVLGRVHYKFTGGTSTDPTVSTNWLGGDIPPASNPFEIVAGNFELNQNATYGNVIVDPTAKLTLNDTKILTVPSLLLKSDATGTATFVDKNATPSTISATVQQYLPATDRNWYVSSPIESATNGNLATGASVVEYNEELGTWPTVSGTLNPMKGYISTAGSAGTGTLSFSGNLNSGSKSVTLSGKGSIKTGFNLVGNPYPSYLMWTEALANSANCLTTIWYRTKSAGVYSFQTYNASGDIGVPLSTSRYIPPMQAFWVRTSVNGSTLAVDNSMRSHGDGSSNLLKAPSANKTAGQLVRLQVSNGTNSDETVIYFNPNADNGFDTFDSPKISANNVSIPEIYTTAGTEQLVINGMKTVTENTVIPLGFRTGTSNDFTLVATELKNIESGIHIILKDSLLKSEIELTEGIAYNFSSDVTTSSTGRFNLVFRTSGVATDVSNANLLKSQTFVNAANQIVIVTSGNCKYDIFNSVGQKINEGFTKANRIIVSVQEAGMYIVKLSESGQNYCSKVIIK